MLNGCKFQTFEVDRKRLTKHCIISVKYIDDEGDEQQDFGLIREIYLLNPFPAISNPFNGVYVRCLWYQQADDYAAGDYLNPNPMERRPETRIMKLSDKIGLWPLKDACPCNYIIIQLNDSKVEIIDTHRQFV